MNITDSLKDVEMSFVILENKVFRLEIDEHACAQSLILKTSGEELLSKSRFPLFSVTQDRPFNNENKLIYMNKRTSYKANRLQQKGCELIVGFEVAPYEAIVEVDVKDEYISFTLKEFIVRPNDYDYLKMDTPPVREFRLATIPIKSKQNFGKWLNVSWDDRSAVALIGTTPHARIDCEEGSDGLILTADAVSGIKLCGVSTVLIVSPTEVFLDAIDTVEKDFDMPRGVKSRRDANITSSIYWTSDINPQNVDEHIELMKKGGFSLALFYYRSFFGSGLGGFLGCSDYSFRREYSNGLESLREVLEKVRSAGIIPGLHILHTHIGLGTSYVTPKADRRLNLKQRYTLSRDLGLDDTTVYVDENPSFAVVHPDCRKLSFMGEIISYESFTDEPPYCFKNCKRGDCNTDIITHKAGEIGGILDISEYLATSVYIDQNSDLQDEIADQISTIYSSGFGFIYFDGSEGVNPPFEYHVPNAQYRVYKKLPTAPLFCEGAAKSHFSWHMLSGANAFDIFQTSVFKEMIDRFPVIDAREMKNDFTRVNFGWWELYPDTRPDIYEYGMMRATAWDCPASIMISAKKSLNDYPLRDCSLEVVRRWEDAKKRGFFTDEIKADLRQYEGEMLLFINENGEYELMKCSPVNTTNGFFAYTFEKCGKAYASICYVGEERMLYIPIDVHEFRYFDDRTNEDICVSKVKCGLQISVGPRRFISADCPLNELRIALEQAEIL